MIPFPLLVKRRPQRIVYLIASFRRFDVILELRKIALSLFTD